MIQRAGEVDRETTQRSRCWSRIYAGFRVVSGHYPHQQRVPGPAPGPRAVGAGCQDRGMTSAGPTPDDVDAFLTGLLARDDEALAAAARDSEAGGLPSI